MSRNNYAKIRNFGPSTTAPNYLSVCLDNTIDAAFLMGEPTWKYNSRTLECQALLASYIAENSKSSKHFDQVSTAAINLVGSGYPNQLANCSFGNCNNNQINDSSYGTQILNNAARMKYCAFDNSTIQMVPFNVNDPASPLIPNLVGNNIKSICSVDPATVDSDPIIREMLKNPAQHIDLLNNIRMNTPNLEGTSLGQFYKLNTNYFNYLSR
jgi:hypothetical protein